MILIDASSILWKLFDIEFPEIPIFKVVDFIAKRTILNCDKQIINLFG